MPTRMQAGGPEHWPVVLVVFFQCLQLSCDWIRPLPAFEHCPASVVECCEQCEVYAEGGRNRLGTDVASDVPRELVLEGINHASGAQERRGRVVEDTVEEFYARQGEQEIAEKTAA